MDFGGKPIARIIADGGLVEPNWYVSDGVIYAPPETAARAAELYPGVEVERIDGEFERMLCGDGG